MQSACLCVPGLCQDPQPRPACRGFHPVPSAASQAAGSPHSAASHTPAATHMAQPSSCCLLLCSPTEGCWRTPEQEQLRSSTPGNPSLPKSHQGDGKFWWDRRGKCKRQLKTRRGKRRPDQYFFLSFCFDCGERSLVASRIHGSPAQGSGLQRTCCLLAGAQNLL